MKIPNHSYTRTKTFARTCERRYFYETQEPWSDTPATLKGGAVHDALEDVAKLMMAGASVEDAIASATVVPVMDINPATEKPIVTGEEIYDYLGRAVSALKNITPVSAEEWFRVNLGAERNYVGKIDLVSSTTPIADVYSRRIEGSEEGWCVLDWKTTGNPASIKDKSQAKKSIQAAGYCVAASEVYGREIKTAGFLYLLPAGPVQGTIVTFTKGELKIAERWLRDTLQVIDGRWEEYLRREDEKVWALAEPGNWLCNKRLCPYWDKCIGKKT